MVKLMARSTNRRRRRRRNAGCNHRAVEWTESEWEDGLDDENGDVAQFVHVMRARAGAARAGAECSRSTAEQDVQNLNAMETLESTQPLALATTTVQCDREDVQRSMNLPPTSDHHERASVVCNNAATARMGALAYRGA